MKRAHLDPISSNYLQTKCPNLEKECLDNIQDNSLPNSDEIKTEIKEEIKEEVDSSEEQNETKEYDISDDDSDIIVLEPPAPNTKVIERLVKIRHQVRYLQSKLMKRKACERIYFELSNENTDMFLKIVEAEAELTTVESKVNTFLDICDKSSEVEKMENEVSQLFGKLKGFCKTIKSLKVEDCFASFYLEIIREDKNFNAFEVGDRIKIPIRISSQHSKLRDIPKALIIKTKHFPQALDFSGNKVHQMLPNNEVVVEITVKNKMDLLFSNAVQHLMVRIPKLVLEKAKSRQLELNDHTMFPLELCDKVVSFEDKDIGYSFTIKVRANTKKKLEPKTKGTLFTTKKFPKDFTLVLEEAFIQSNNELFVTYRINSKTKPLSIIDVVKCTRVAILSIKSDSTSSRGSNWHKEIYMCDLNPAEENIQFGNVQGSFVRVRAQLSTRKKIPKTTKITLDKKRVYPLDPKLMENEVYIRNDCNELILRFTIDESTKNFCSYDVINYYKAFCDKSIADAADSWLPLKMNKKIQFELIPVEENIWFNNAKMEITVKVRIQGIGKNHKTPNGTSIMLKFKDGRDKSGIKLRDHIVWVRNDRNEICITLYIYEKCKFSCSEDVIKCIVGGFPT